MALRLYNTLTRKVEPLRPLEDEHVRMYTCGPTVYNYVHIGNFRTFIFQDLLRRYILYKGFELTHVMNITDVDDKIIAASKAEGVSIAEYTGRYEQAFLDDMETLRIQKPEVMPRATEHIDDMVELVSKLRDKGLTYESDGSIYYRIAGFKNYGKLSRVELDGSGSQARVDSDEYTKENPRDFVLWKGRRGDDAYWESSLGEGRPGWHLECSAMSMKYLGESFDIHCGGVDLVFPHHENEIAQSEGASGKPFVKYWVHGAHLIVEGEKMSKSAGNFYTLRQVLEKGYSPRAVRYLLSSVHYRKQLNFTFDGIEQAAAAVRRVDDLLRKLRELEPAGEDDERLAQAVEEARAAFEAALDDDLNVSEALAALFELVRQANVSLDEGKLGSGNRREIMRFFQDADSVFDVFQLEEEELPDEDVARLIEERIEARRLREFARADEIRDHLAEQGIILEDTKEGTRWKRVH
ncbi:MAG TPA: cysteine--tRNA ligase [Acidobacteriota bacterium]|nr:cysteine--tRNA ligase [Acidobacteriota bacterium]